ncbi:MAG TPA: glycosyltransferase [Caldisericia bacterium]|nr:glycosyltransferase [Caldisericia bacterium]
MNKVISPIIKSQADSLKNKEVELEVFPVIGQGLRGYLKNIPKLKKNILTFKPDIIHFHYSFCGIIASLAFKKQPIVVSLMGSDTHQSKLMKSNIRYFANYR